MYHLKWERLRSKKVECRRKAPYIPSIGSRSSFFLFGWPFGGCNTTFNTNLSGIFKWCASLTSTALVPHWNLSFEPRECQNSKVAWIAHGGSTITCFLKFVSFCQSCISPWNIIIISHHQRDRHVKSCQTSIVTSDELPIYILGFFQVTNSQTAVVWHLCPSGPFCCRGHTNIKNSNVLNRTLARQLRLVVMAEIWNVKSGYQWQSLWHLGPSLSDPRSGKRNMPIPSPYRLTSYLLLKCSLSPFGVPWNDRFVFNYYPYRINTTKKSVDCVFMVLLVLARACRVANCQPLPAWLQAQTSCHNFTFVNAAGVAWQCWTRSDSRSRDICLLGLSGSSLLFMFFGFSTIDCLILWRLMIACDLHVLNAPNSDDIWKCDITCAGGNGPAHVNFRLGSSRSKAR